MTVNVDAATLLTRMFASFVLLPPSLRKFLALGKALLIPTLDCDIHVNCIPYTVLNPLDS